MARPPKDADALMNRPLRIMVTAQQKQQIDDAAEASGASGTAAWARMILLQAASDQLGGDGPKTPRRSGAHGD